MEKVVYKLANNIMIIVCALLVIIAHLWYRYFLHPQLIETDIAASLVFSVGDWRESTEPCITDIQNGMHIDAYIQHTMTNSWW